MNRMQQSAHAWFQKQRERASREALHERRMQHYLQTGTFDDPRDALIEVSRPFTPVTPVTVKPTKLILP